MGYEGDRRWSDKYIPQIKQIVGPLLLQEAPFEVDTKEATDLICLSGRNMAIACRLRTPGYAERYPWEFTIRSRRPSGVKTELQKIIDGWCDIGFYGHVEEDRIGRWFVFSFDVFRANLIQHKADLKYELQGNYDGSSQFIGFDIRSFTPDILISSSHEVPFE